MIMPQEATSRAVVAAEAPKAALKDPQQVTVREIVEIGAGAEHLWSGSSDALFSRLRATPRASAG